METFPWTCPFCDRDTTITENDFQRASVVFGKDNKHGTRMFLSFFVRCPNPKCKEFDFSIAMWSCKFQNGGHVPVDPLQTWNLIPPSAAKVFPEYIPKPIRADYLEACLIRDLSPKASATLARRCLQGMIRDFWKLAKGRLIDEIDAIKDKVDPLTWNAIDAVRKIGNIGAHMEKDINVIVEVEPEEAGKLIELIELLVRDWYITKHDREERLKSIVAVKDAKEAAKAAK